MFDRLGTSVGFIVGAALIVFGITWPDHLSNFYVYQLNHVSMTDAADALTILGHTVVAAGTQIGKPGADGTKRPIVAIWR